MVKLQLEPVDEVSGWRLDGLPRQNPFPPEYLSIEPNQPDSSSRLQKHAVRSFKISYAASIVVSSMRTLVFFGDRSVCALPLTIFIQFGFPWRHFAGGPLKYALETDWQESNLCISEFC